MERTDKACQYHEKGCNCCQSVLAAFSDLTGISEAESMRIGGGFGNGAGTGELCGAITGAVMVLGMLAPCYPNNPAAVKREAVGLSKEFQKRFQDFPSSTLNLIYRTVFYLITHKKSLLSG